MHSDPHRRPDAHGMSPHRACLWFKRSCWLLLAFLAAMIVLLALGWPSHWLAVVASFTFAEVTRRISSESNPDVPLRWRDLLRYLARGLPNTGR